MTETTLTLSRSRFAQHFLRLRSEPYGFDQRVWLPAIFDSSHKKKVLYTGRQISKSTTDAATMLTDSGCIPHFQTTLVMPTQMQTQRFSNLRLKPMIIDSPRFRALWFDNQCTDQVFNKTFSNGSVINMGSAFQDADSMRGVSSDRLILDEVQDLLTESVRVLEQTASASPYRYFLYSGTPKSTSHSIESYWRRSTQNVWAVRCEHCTYWNVPLGEQNLRPHGLSCSNCEGLIDSEVGEWVCSFPDAEWEGWHVSQLMCPWIIFDEIWEQYAGVDPYPRNVFYNEVLGFSYDVGHSPVSEGQIMACCDEDYSMEDAKRTRPQKMFAGLDWALQSPDMSVAPSYTILTIGGLENDRIRVHDIKKYAGFESDPDFQIADITRRCNEAGVEILGCDYGVGHKENERLRKLLNNSPGSYKGDRLMEFRYTSQSRKIDWDPKRRSFGLNRTLVLADAFEAIRQGGYRFPKWKEMSGHARDVLAVFEDRGNRFTREVRYDHSPERPDDWLHSLSYMSLSCRYFWRRLAD